MACAQVSDNRGEHNLLKKTLGSQNSKWNVLHQRMNADDDIWLVLHQPFCNFPADKQQAHRGVSWANGQNMRN